MAKLEKSEQEWRAELTPEEYRVLREKGTEAPFSGEYDHVFEPGTYRCAGCGAELFDSDAKYDSGCGWPAFSAPAGEQAVAEETDTATAWCAPGPARPAAAASGTSPPTARTRRGSLLHQLRRAQARRGATVRRRGRLAQLGEQRHRRGSRVRALHRPFQARIAAMSESARSTTTSRKSWREGAPSPSPPEPAPAYVHALGFTLALVATRGITTLLHERGAGERRHHRGRRHIHHFVFGMSGCFCSAISGCCCSGSRTATALVPGHGVRLRSLLGADPRRVRPLAQPARRLLGATGSGERRRARDLRRRLPLGRTHLAVRGCGVAAPPRASAGAGSSRRTAGRLRGWKPRR